jgi:hypothetical protein
MSKESWTGSASAGGSRRRFAIAATLAALILLGLALVSPRVDSSRAAIPTTTGSTVGSTGTPDPPDWYLTPHTIGKGSISAKVGSSGTPATICDGSAAADETTTTSCTAKGYYSGQTVTLTAAPAAGYGFVGWSGDCTGTGTCTVSDTASVTARFLDGVAPAAPTINTPASDGSVTLNSDGRIVAKATNSDSTVDHLTCKVGTTGVPCSSGALFNTPAEETGTYTLSVTATDLRGMVSAAATRTYSVVRKSTATVSGAPAEGSASSNASPVISISGDHGATLYQCNLNSAGWQSCPSPHTSSNLGALEDSVSGKLSDGAKTVQVRTGVTFNGADYYGDPTAVLHWTVDTQAPDTEISSGPASETTDRNASLTFADPHPTGTPLHFQCRLDGGAWSACTSGEQQYTTLAAGAHTVEVRAVDAAGNTDATPAGWSWTVLSVDADGDGFRTADDPVDCNDANPAIHPGATDIPDDGIDQDCSGADAINLDRDGDGANRPLDCNDGNPAIHPGAIDTPEDGIDQDCSGADAINLDRDGDGSDRPLDCNDADPAIHPGAIDTPGDGTDQDCSGADAAWPEVHASLHYASRRSGAGSHRFTQLTKAVVSHVPKGGKVTLTCKGKGCTFKSRKVRVRKGKANLSRMLRKTRFGKKAKLTVTISAPGHASRIFTLTMRPPKAPKRVTSCRKPGAKTTYRCSH